MKASGSVATGLTYQLTAIWVFARRELTLLTYFRTSFLLDQASTAVYFLIYGVIASFGPPTGTETYHLSYASFVTWGLMVNTLMGAALAAPYSGLMASWWEDRLEVLMMSPISLPLFTLGVSCGGYVRALFQVLIYALLGGLLLGAFATGLYEPGHMVGVVGIILLGVASCTGIGLASASMVYIIDARGGSDPVRLVVEALTGVAAGVFVPVAFLPTWLKLASSFLPQTYALDAIRTVLSPQTTMLPRLPLHAILNNVSPLVVDLGALVLSTAVWLLIGWGLFKRGLALARQDGRLSKWR